MVPEKAVDEVLDLAMEVMEHVRALRQVLLSGGPEPGDQARSGLTGPQVAAMAVLVCGGATTVTGLAQQLHLSHSTTSGIVDRLEARGLVTRARDDRDRRITRIAVTSIVTAYVRRIGHSPYDVLSTALDRATPAQRAVVLDGLSTLRALLDGR